MDVIRLGRDRAKFSREKGLGQLENNSNLWQSNKAMVDAVWICLEHPDQLQLTSKQEQSSAYPIVDQIITY